jgi:hypothetical protein
MTNASRLAPLEGNHFRFVALDELILTILRSGGTLLVAVPGWPSLWGPRDVQAGHLRRYRRRDLSNVLRQAGFEVREVRGYQFLLLPVIVMSRLVGRLRGDHQLRSEERVRGRANRVLLAVNRLEARAARVAALRPPTGSSLIVVAVSP